MEYIYFISQPNNGRIKIGTTRNLNTRLTGIASGLADRVLLLGNIAGGRPLERAIHEFLKLERLQGEFFRDCSAVRTTIDALLAEGPELAIGFTGEKFSPQPREDPSKQKFGMVCRALWPERTAFNLARRGGFTERAAQYYIDGERKPSWHAIRVILDEIME
jgi:hypothetical protein